MATDTALDAEVMSKLKDLEPVAPKKFVRVRINVYVPLVKYVLSTGIGRVTWNTLLYSLRYFSKVVVLISFSMALLLYKLAVTDHATLRYGRPPFP